MPLATQVLPRWLLSHEPHLEPEERELLELLATEEARGLYRARGIAAGAPS
ncbi:hypothetical protein [Cystobacter fuscus]|uniref:hypothetical protein n=1 Tax=Cystobacter fuscus TaxID=43 RepID=UPI0037BF44AB